MVEEIRDFEWLTLCLFNYLIYNLYLKENPVDFQTKNERTMKMNCHDRFGMVWNVYHGVPNVDIQLWLVVGVPNVKIQPRLGSKKCMLLLL